MTELFTKFSLDAVKFTKGMFVCAFLIWLMVVGCAVSSIVTQPFSRRRRLGWILIVVCLPVVGLLAYLPFSLRNEADSALAILFPRGRRDD